MKKLFSFAAALLASVCLYAATETHPSEAQKDTDVKGVSYTIPGTYIAGLGGTKAGDMQTKGIKFRLSNKVDKNNKGFYFKVNEGYKITDIAFCGHVNDDTKKSTLAVVLVDGVNIDFAPVELPGKSSSTKFAISGIEAIDSVVLVFQGDGTQANLEYTVTYEEYSSKTVVSTVESLKAVTINDYPIAAADLVTLQSEHTLILEDSVYVTAPVVKFTKHTVITYDDESTKEKDEVIEKTSQQAQASMWGAMVDIAGVAYSVYTVKPLSYTVTYKAGDQVLGTEVVAANGNPKEYAQYESLPLSTFEGWYKDAELTQAVASMAAEVITADVTYYAKLSKAYASSLNIEQLVLDEGKGAKIDSILIARGYAFENINELDSLNDEKTARNEPYLGLKLKTAGAFVACNIKAGDSIVVKFGNVGDDLKIGVNGDYRTLPKAEAVLLGYKATADSYMEIITTTKSTVVLKQIMINEDIAPVVLPGEGGGEETKDTDATIKSLSINGVAVEAVEGVYAFEVPADENLAQVEVVYELNSAKATADPASGFKVDVPAAGEAANTQLITVTAESGDKKEYTVSVTRASSEAIDNTDATTKAVKVIRNGQLVIIRDSKEFNVLGAQTK